VIVPPNNLQSCTPDVRIARPCDLSFVMDVSKRETYAIGFIPRFAMQRKIELGRILLGQENDCEAGFLHYGSFRAPEVRIFQSAIRYDARRRGLALAMVESLVSTCRANGNVAISLRCLEELEANAFWEAAGFVRIAQEPGRRGTLNVWVRPINPGKVTIESRVQRCRKCGRPTPHLWTAGGKRWSLCPDCLLLPTA
jgi:GNAT superfamily N-acetyltransferase